MNTYKLMLKRCKKEARGYSRSIRRTFVPTCQRVLLVCMLTCQNACQLLILIYQRANKRANVLYGVCQCLNLTCQSDRWRANFSTWLANAPKGVPIFQTFLLWNAKGNLYTSQKNYKKIYIIIDIIVICVSYVYVSYIKIVLYFISILHTILKKSCGIHFFRHTTFPEYCPEYSGFSE